MKRFARAFGLLAILIASVVSFSACSWFDFGDDDGGIDEDYIPSLSMPTGVSFDLTTFVLSWSPVSNASSYRISVTMPTSHVFEIKTTSIDISEVMIFGVYTYTISIYALSDDLEQYLDSMPATRRYTVTLQPPPENI